jgi:hypothetical protein
MLVRQAVLVVVQKRTGHKSRSPTESHRVSVQERRKPSKDSFMPPIKGDEKRDAE